MTKRLVAAVAALASVPAALAISAVSAASGPATAAEYCVYHDGSYIGKQEIVPPGRWCVPGP